MKILFFLCSFKCFKHILMYFKTEHSIKKAISLSFLLLVSIVILAHAVIPHHHHRGISFILEATYPEHDDLNENCLLSNIYVKKSNNKQTFQLYDSDYDPFPCILTLFLDNSTYQIKNNVSLLFRQKPYLHSNHTEFIARSAGLRAPPVC